MFIEYVTLNLPFPGVKDTVTLDCLGQALMHILDEHFNNGIDIDDEMLIHNAKLTMGDCASEHCIDDADFVRVYNNADNALALALAMYTQEIKNFAMQLTSIGDIMMFEYPGMLRFCVKEGVSPFGLSSLYV